jgi:hypothetical protein
MLLPKVKAGCRQILLVAATTVAPARAPSQALKKYFAH